MNNSTTKKILVCGMAVALLKLLFSGMVIKGFVIPVFGGAEFGLVTASLAGLYIGRRSTIVNEQNRDV